MPEMHLPWLVLCIAFPAVGCLCARFARDQDAARRQSLIAAALGLTCAIAAWLDFGTLQSFEAGDPGDVVGTLFHRQLLNIDELSAPKLPLAALIYFLTLLATLRTKVRDFSFARFLASEAILLATLACKIPLAIDALLVVGTLPPYLELRKAGKPRRVYAIYMAAFGAFLCLGRLLLETAPRSSIVWTLGMVLLTVALLLRVGVVPLHSWLPDLFEHATFSTALLFVTPMVGIYGLTRSVVGIAPAWIPQVISLAALTTAAYAAGMALTQRESRRFFCYLFLSHSSLVLVGFQAVTPIGLTGSLILWLSVALSLTGFGLTLRSVEFRIGRISLAEFHGLYRHVPMLATLFLITGLASIGFPGTVGFVGLELLVDGAVETFPVTAAAIVVVAALNGLAVLQAYFRIFTGKPHATSIDLSIRPAERVAVLVLIALILGGGLYPQPGALARYHAASGLQRAAAK